MESVFKSMSKQSNQPIYMSGVHLKHETSGHWGRPVMIGLIGKRAWTAFFCILLPFSWTLSSASQRRRPEKSGPSTQVVVEWCFFWGWLMKAPAHKNQKCSSSSDKRCWLHCWSILWLLAHLIFLHFFPPFSMGFHVYVCVCICVVSVLMRWAVFLCVCVCVCSGVSTVPCSQPHLSISSTWQGLPQLSSLWYPHRHGARAWCQPLAWAFQPLW